MDIRAQELLHCVAMSRGAHFSFGWILPAHEFGSRGKPLSSAFTERTAACQSSSRPARRSFIEQDVNRDAAPHEEGDETLQNIF